MDSLHCRVYVARSAISRLLAISVANSEYREEFKYVQSCDLLVFESGRSGLGSALTKSLGPGANRRIRPTEHTESGPQIVVHN